MNSAIIKESSGKSAEELNVPGLCSVLLKHEVKSTEATFNWTGPKINAVEWAKMMAFFEWTYESEKSESQVRWYVHPEHGWRCWAFPQKGGTGMTTKEIPDHPLAQEQRKLFPPGEGWSYFMTVHHHCAAGAFQSSTDESDEKQVDGIHITIGKLDCPKRDIHIRMYLRGHKFQPRMQFWWEIGQDLQDKADMCFKLFGYMPDLDEQARSKMALSHELLRPDWTMAKDGEKFPNEWRENYIVEKPVEVMGAWRPGAMYYKGGYQPGQETRNYKSWCYCCQQMAYHSSAQCPQNPANRGGVEAVVEAGTSEEKKDEGNRKNRGNKNHKLAKTLREIMGDLAVRGYQEEDAYALLQEALDGVDADANQVVYADLIDDGVNLKDMAAYFNRLLRQVNEQEAKKQLQEGLKEAKQEAASNPPTTSLHPWEY